jgi:glycine/D-amino acid oxidase-like deaminating enzyme
MEVDDLVMGAGMAGVAVASLLGQSGRRVLFVEVHDVPGGQAHYVFGWPPWSMTRAAGAPIAPSPNRSRRVAGPRILCAATESLLVEDEVLTMCTRRRAAPVAHAAPVSTLEDRRTLSSDNRRRPLIDVSDHVVDAERTLAAGAGPGCFTLPETVELRQSATRATR